jgi:uncharacterized protein YggT (Ycf19 family)
MVVRLLGGLINFVLILVEAFLLVRVILRFFAANPTTPFVHWIYTSSSTLIDPFRGIFPTTVIGHNHVVDFTALFAMLVYGLIALAFLALLNWLNPTRYATTAPVVTKKSRL